MKKFWEIDFDVLARYNAEEMRGIVHTKEYAKRMKIIQKRYDERIKECRQKI